MSEFLKRTADCTHTELLKMTKRELANELWGEIQTNKELNAQLRTAPKPAPPAERDDTDLEGTAEYRSRLPIMIRSDNCQGCNRVVKRMPRCGKRRYPHKCPHGKWCACGHRLNGTHANHNEFCDQCRADEHNKTGEFAVRRAAERGREHKPQDGDG